MNKPARSQIKRKSVRPQPAPPRKPAVMDIGKWISLELTAAKYGFTMRDEKRDGA